jgi:hypothetical protein
MHMFYDLGIFILFSTNQLDGHTISSYKKGICSFIPIHLLSHRHLHTYMLHHINQFTTVMTTEPALIIEVIQ